MHYRTTVTTLIEPIDRSKVDAATARCFNSVHACSVDEATKMVRERPVRAVLVSPNWMSADEIRRFGKLVRDFPGVPAIALLSKHDAMASERLLHLGSCGVRRVVDVSTSSGWERLREAITSMVTPATNRILAHVMGQLGGASQDAVRIFELIVVVAPLTPTVRMLCKQLNVHPTTLMTRFMRSGIPSPKRYLAAIRLLYATALFEMPGFSIADVSYRLCYSSPQSFGRHVRCVLGTTAAEFRDRRSLPSALEDFADRYILPYRAALRVFHPL